MRTIIVRLLGVTLLIASGYLMAQDNQNTEATEADDVLEEVVTVGSRVKGRSALESNVPVDVLPVGELKKTPTADIKDAIQAVSPSFYVHRESASDQDSFSRETNLRGLDGGEILVLLNGKRVHRSAIVNKIGIQQPNLSTFGAMGIQNVEILRDGASALYGADAVAGVINVVLDDSEGITAEMGYSKFYEGDGALFTVASKYGTRFLNDEGFLTVSASYSSQDPTQRNLPHLGAVAMLADAERRGVQIDVDPTKVQARGISDEERSVFTWNAGLAINDGVELYTFGNFAWIRSTQNFNYRENLYCAGGSHRHPGLRPCSDIPELHFVDGSIGSPPAQMSPTRLTLAQLTELIGAEAAQNAYYLLADGPNGTSLNGAQPTGFDPKLAFPNGYTPYFDIEGPDIGAYAGLRGELSNGLTWDLSGSFGRSRVDYYSHDTFNPSLGAPMASDGTIDYANIQTEFYVGGLVNWEAAVNADFTYVVNTSAIDRLQISFGGAYRWEHYYNIPGEEASWQVGPLVDLSVGSNGFSGIAPATQFTSDRTNYAAYIDFDAQVNDRLNLSAAARYEHFSDFGDNVSVKGSARFQLIDDVLAIRGGVSTGFHAPSLGQIDNLQLTTGFFAGVVNFGGIFPASHPLSIELGAEPLGPEEAVNFSTGLVWTPGDSTSITFDAFQINLDDRIRLSQRYQASNPLYAPAFQKLIDSGFPGAAFLTDARFYGNGVDTETKGIEIVGSQQLELADNPLSLTLAYAYVQTDVTSFDPQVSDELTNLNTELFSPPHRAILTANYFVNDWDFGARVRFWGSQELALGYRNPDGSYRVDEISSVAFLDVSAGYQFNNWLSVTIGADNVLDEYPESIPELLEPSMRRGYQYYPEGPPFQGGSYYIRARVSF